MSCVAGIDIGSSAIKAVLFDATERKVIASERRELEPCIVNEPAGHFEQDPNSIRDAAFVLISSLARKAESSGRRIEAIAFTGQMHGGLILDSELQPLTNFITWQDKRGDEIHKEKRSYVQFLRDVLHGDQTGVSIHTGFLMSTLYWFTCRNAIPRKAVHLLGIYDWLSSLLSDRIASDVSSVAAWGMYDPIELVWRNDLLRPAGIAESLLPEVVEPGAYVGNIDPRFATKLGLSENVRIHAPIGDTQAAYIGSECKSNELLLNFGPGSQSMWETTLPFATQGTDIRYLKNGRYLCCAPTLAGGEAYRIVANFFCEAVKKFTGQQISFDQAIDVMDRLALESDSLGLSFDPIFQGSKFREDGDRASISGITRNNFQPGAMVRALVEGMIEEVATPYFEREGEMVHTRLIGAGSAMRRNRALREVAEQRFGMPLAMGSFDDEAAVGAAMLCLNYPPPAPPASGRGE